MINFLDEWMIKPFFSFLHWLFVEESKKEMTGSCTCTLCKRKIEYIYQSRDRYDFFTEHEHLKSLGWQGLWLTKGEYVCPTCIAQLESGLVPGVGVVLVTKEMFEKGKAFTLDSFEEQNEKL